MEYNRVIYTRPYDSEVEYLESSGTQWIDTKIIATNNTSIDTGFLRVPYKPNFYIVGARPSGYKNNEYVITPYNNGACSIIYGNSEGTKLNSPIVNNTYYRCVTNKNRLSLYDSEGTIVTSVVALTNSFNTQYSLAVFGENIGGTVIISDVKLRLYYLKIYDNTTLVRDLIPVRKGNVGYMYDKVSGKLFGNKGTGNFILGQDVANPVPNIRRVFFFDNKRYAMPRRLEEGFDYEKYEWIGTTLSTLEIHGGIITSDTMSSDLHSLVVRAYRPIVTSYSWDKFYYPVWNDEGTKTSFATRCNDSRTGNVYVLFKQQAKGNWNFVISFSNVSWKEVEFTWGSSNYIRSRGETSGGASTNQNGMNYTYYNDIRGLEMIFRLSNLSYSKIQLNRWYFKGANGIIDLYPCKLIRDIPSIFAKDNQIHYKGETGLYNAIDGKFWAIEDSFVTNE